MASQIQDYIHKCQEKDTDNIWLNKFRTLSHLPEIRMGQAKPKVTYLGAPSDIEINHVKDFSTAMSTEGFTYEKDIQSSNTKEDQKYEDR